jgi:membrane protease YdiL (CAAX protease family)
MPILPAAADERVEYDALTALQWSLIPGAGHFYLDQDREGILIAGSVAALAGAGIWLDQRNDDLGRNDEVNSFWILAEKGWELSFFTTYRNGLRAQGVDPVAHGVDDISVLEMFKAPFRRESLRDPMVWLAGLLGLAAAALDGHDAERRYGDVAGVGILGSDANPEWGLGVYGADAFALSLAAGVGEEAVWRGLIQNELETEFGPRGGLWSSAGLFGLAHIIDLDGDIVAERTVGATVAGLYLGHMYQRDKHRLSKPIAAHFWFNFAAMMTAFALDPEDNPLGVDVSFRF